MHFLTLFTLLAVTPALACNPGDMQDCSVPHGSGYKNCAVGTWSGCVVAMCDIGYYIGGIASYCAPIGGSSSGASGGSTKTVTVTSTSTGTGTRPPPAPPPASPGTSTTTVVSTATSDDGLAQRDAYCRSASLAFLGAVNLLKQGQADAGLAAYAQGQESLRRAQALGNGGCDAGTLENYLEADSAAKSASAQLAKETGLKPHALAQYTQEQAVLAGTTREPTPAAGLRALVKDLPGGEARSKLLASLDKVPPGTKAVETAAATGTHADTSGDEASSGTAPTPATGAPAAPEFSVPQASAKPTTPTRMKDGDSTLLELKELGLMLGSAAMGEGASVLEDKLRDFSLFARVRMRYRARESTLGGRPL